MADLPMDLQSCVSRLLAEKAERPLVETYVSLRRRSVLPGVCLPHQQGPVRLRHSEMPADLRQTLEHFGNAAANQDGALAGECCGGPVATLPVKAVPGHSRGSCARASSRSLP